MRIELADIAFVTLCFSTGQSQHEAKLRKSSVTNYKCLSLPDLLKKVQCTVRGVLHFSYICLTSDIPRKNNSQIRC